MIKLPVLIASLLLTLVNLSAQCGCDSREVFVIAENPPKPNISYEQFEEILNHSINLSDFPSPKDNVIQIRFLVNCKGDVCNFTSLLPIDNELKENLSQTIRSQVHWIPARQASRIVDCWTVLTMRIEGGKFKILSEKELKKINKK